MPVLKTSQVIRKKCRPEEKCTLFVSCPPFQYMRLQGIPSGGLFHPFLSFHAVDLGRVRFDIYNRRSVNGIQPPDPEDIPPHFEEVNKTERYRVRAVGRADGKNPFLFACPGRDCLKDGPVGPVEPAEDPELPAFLQLEKRRQIFFIDNNLRDQIREAALPGSIAPRLVRRTDIPDGMQFNGCRTHGW